MTLSFACLRFSGTEGWVIEGARAIAVKGSAVTAEVGYIDHNAGVLTLRAENADLIEQAVRRLLADPICSRHFRITREYG